MGRMQAVLHDISLYNHEISLSFTVPFHCAISLCVAMDTGLPPSHPRTIRRTCVLMLDSDVCHRFWSPRQESPGRSRPAMEPRFEHHRLREHRLALTGVGAGRVEGWPCGGLAGPGSGCAHAGWSCRPRPFPDRTGSALTVRTRLQLFRVEEGKDLPIGVVGGDTVQQAQPRLNPGAVKPVELLQLYPGVGTADDDGQG